MKFFIPENYIAFCFVENFYLNHFEFISSFHLNNDISGSFFSSLNDSYFHNFDFNYKKIKWNYYFKRTFFLKEAPYYFSIRVNDRFSWVYEQNAWLIPTSMQCMMNMDWLLIENNDISFLRNLIMTYEDCEIGYTIHRGSNIVFAYILLFAKKYRDLFEDRVFFEGSGWLCQLYSYTFFLYDLFIVITKNEIFERFFFWHMHLHNMIFRISRYFLFTFFFFVILYFLVCCKFYFELNRDRNDFYIKEIFENFFSIFYLYSNLFSRLLSIDFDLFLFSFFVKLKKYCFSKPFYLFFFIIIYYYFYYFYFIFSMLLSIFYFFFKTFKIDLFLIFINKYVIKYSIIYSRQYFFWLYLVIKMYNYFLGTDIKKSFIGYHKWIHVYEQWYNFVYEEWDRFSEYIEEGKRRKRYEKQLRKIRLKKDRSVGLDELKWEKIELEVEKQRLESYKRSERIKSELERIEQQKKELNLKILKERRKIKKSNDKIMYETEMNNTKSKSFWRSLKEEYIKQFKTKERIKKEDDYDELIKKKYNLVEELGSDLMYYKWLVNHKYIMLKAQFSYIDYLEFMVIQRNIFLYYVDNFITYRRIFYVITIIGYWYRGFVFTQTRQYKLPEFFMIGHQMDFKNLKFNYMLFYYLFYYMKKLFMNIIDNYFFFNLIFVYMMFYLWYIIFRVAKFFSVLFSNDRLLIKYKYRAYFEKLHEVYMKLFFYRVIFYFVRFIVNLIKSFYNNLKFLIKTIINGFVNLVINAFNLFELFLEFLNKRYGKRYYRFKRTLFLLWFFIYNKIYILFSYIRTVLVLILFFYIIFFYSPFNNEIVFEFFKYFFEFFISLYFYFYDFKINSNISINSSDIYLILNNYIKDYTLMNYFNQIFSYIFVKIMYIISWFAGIIIGIFSIFESYFDFYYYDFVKIENDFLFFYEKMNGRHVRWENKHYIKNFLFGRLHYVYYFYKNKHNEFFVFSNYLYYKLVYYYYFYKRYFYLAYTYFFQLIIFFPIWVLRFGLDYIIYWNYEYSNLYEFALNAKLLCFYIRWHFISFHCWTLITFIFFINDILDNIIYLFFVNLATCINKYGYILIYVKNFYDMFFVTVINYFFFRLSTIYFLVVGNFKFILHFFQCIIPFFRFFYKFKLMSFLFFVDFLRSIFAIMFMIYLFFLYFLKTIFEHIHFLFNILGYNIIFYEWMNFVYDIVMHPFIKAREYGFYWFYGDHGLNLSGVRSGTSIGVYIKHRKYAVIVRHDYLDRYFRWAFWYASDIKNFNNFFILRSVNYGVNYRSSLITIYFIVFNIIVLNVFIILFYYFNKIFNTKMFFMYDSAYNWFKVTQYNKTLSLNVNEMRWLTSNKWINFFGSLDLFKNDILKNKYDSKDFEEFFMHTFKELDYPNSYYNYKKKTGYKAEMYNLFKYGYKEYSGRKFDLNKIRYLNIVNYINILFDKKLINTKFLRQVFKNNLNMKLPKKFTYMDLKMLQRNNTFYKFWIKFCIPLLLNTKSNYRLFKHFSKKSMDREKIFLYFKALYLVLLDKGENFKDLHDFYFFEQDFYNDFMETWKYINDESSILRNIAVSRDTHRMVYAGKKEVSYKYFNYEYLELVYETLEHLIRLNDLDNNNFDGFFDFSMALLINTSRAVNTDVSFEKLEHVVLNDWEDFLEYNWEQTQYESDTLTVYYNLSNRLRDSLLQNNKDDKAFEMVNIPALATYETTNLEGKLLLRGFFGVHVNQWMGLTIIVPIIVLFYFYRLFTVFCIGNHKVLKYIHEFTFIFPYYFFYIYSHWFFILIGLKFFFFKKMFKKKRKYRLINYYRFYDYVEKFQEIDFISKAIVLFVANNVTTIILPSYEFVIFWILLILISIVIFRILYSYY